ncbi:lysosomal alpha-glucosidase protein [Plakobranchus ocellatus]|uniref:Lysosomal alpha-glucosidase protein n=1 Tax=Plakobranchus ocellatus TaxID=259542 RepID=A0AAV4AEJ5_9GAST|nr:lysosomal alpha-glucosidase protein [Plakobranchus ocellatus]
MAKNCKVNKRGIFIAVGVAAVVVVIVTVAAVLANKSNDSSEPTAEAYKGIVPWDCFPEAQGNPANVNEAACKLRGCKYDSDISNDKRPACSFQDKGYRLRVKDISHTERGFVARLGQVGSAPFGGDVTQWIFRFEERGDNVARFTFDTEDGSRYKVPKAMNLQTLPADRPKYDIQITNNETFAFKIIRKQTGTAIWDSAVGPGSLILSDQFLQVSTRLPSTNVYGLGEHTHGSLRHDFSKTWPSFSRDQPPSFDSEANLYGVHPFYTCVEDKKGNTHGVLMLNSNAQEYAFSTLPSLTFRTIGGILDFYLFLGPTPENVIEQYTEVIGRPFMPPYWSLGFQLCRYGYNNISNLMDAVESTAKYEIPQDVQYVDIDHMDTQKIFTVDHKSFPNLNDYFIKLRAEGMRIIYILDPCIIANETNYQPYEKIKAINDGFIKWENPDLAPNDSTGENGAVLGYVWPRGKVVFPDFMKPDVQKEWKELIKDYRDTLIFDGLWIDMNEPANFGTNEERPFNWPEDEKPYWSLKCPKNSLEDPPYRTKACYRFDSESRKARLSDKTLCMGTIQGESNQYKHYDVHSLYGWSQTIPTFEAAREATGERSIVISRSTFPGSGQYAGHWLGDNVSQWKDLHRSIIGMLEFNMFGIPYIGADICGFFGDSNPQLCKRWMQLGAFYTFSRNHNTLGASPQGPGQMGDDVGYASRDIMRVRYQLLPYLYTLFHESHTRGSTVVRPVHHEFPTDTTALSIDKQFMWGKCLLISPILEKDQTKLTYYLPKGKWFNYFTYDLEETEEGAERTVAISDDSKPLLHLRGGCVIVQQDYANNTHFSRHNAISILAALDKDGEATGMFYWDDGHSIDPIQSGEFFKANMSILSLIITCSMFPWDYRGDSRPTDITLLRTLAPVFAAHELLTYGMTKHLLPATKRTKSDTHVYSSVIMGGTTLDPKHNAGRHHRQNVWTTAVLRTPDTIGAQKPVPVQINPTGTQTLAATHM